MNRSYGINSDGKSYRSNHREIRPTKKSYDARKRDPLPCKPGDDPLMITNERPHNVSVKQPVDPEPQTALIAPIKVRGSSRNVQLLSQFEDYIMA